MTEQTTPAGHVPSPRDLAARSGSAPAPASTVQPSPRDARHDGVTTTANGAAHHAGAQHATGAGSTAAVGQKSGQESAAVGQKSGQESTVSPRQVTGAQALVMALEQLGTEAVFGLP